MRGTFTAEAGTGAPGEEWCERRLLARIHRYTLKRLRNEIEPATLADYPAVPVPLAGPRRRAPPGPRSACAPCSASCKVSRCRPRSGSARCCRRASPTTARRCSISSARPARSSGGGRGRAARCRAHARRRSRRRRSRSCRGRRCRCGGRSGSSEPVQGMSGAARARRASAARARRVVLRRDRAGERPAARASRGSARRARRARRRDGRLVRGACAPC